MSYESSIENQQNEREEEENLPKIETMAAKRIPKSSIVTLLVLVYINLLNYMDRFTVSSVLPEIQTWFNIKDEQGGLLQTIFVCSYMVFAPIFGYLGDRFSRKLVMAVGISIWTVTTFSGSLMEKDQYIGFFVLRGLVGIGEASYSTVAPTIIADLFVGDQRSKALSVFYFAIPCGSGLGYIVGSKVSALMGEWQWALRVTPVLGVVAVLLVLVAIHEPKRGAIEVVDNPSQIEDLSESIVIAHSSNYLEDVKKIMKVPSFLYATAGFTCVSFVVGSLAWWMPKFALVSQQKHLHDPVEAAKITIDQVSYIFGIVTFVAGIVGVWVGAEVARRWRKFDMRADALVCGFGVLMSAPFLFFCMYIADKYIILMWVLAVIGEILMFLNWAPNGDILLYVIPPSCRSTAEAIQILIIHVLGDAFSPFIVGLISDTYMKDKPADDVNYKQQGLLYSLYMTPFIACLGAFFYFLCGNHLAEDKRKADEETHNKVIISPPESLLNSLPTHESPLRPSDIYDEETLDDMEENDTANLIATDDNQRSAAINV